VTTVIGEVLAFLYKGSLFTVQGSDQAIIIDEAFFLLTILGIPVFALVLAMIVYSLLRFRANNASEEDAKPVKFHSKWAWSWLAWSTVLCLFVIVTPGYTGLMDLRSTAEDTPDLTIEVTGQKWQWVFKYPDQGITLIRKDEVLVLPNESLIRFEITSLDNDVLHSFWIPAFRQKIDAIPGHKTTLDVTTNRIGSYEDSTTYRVQCTELCGIGHSTMATNVKVVSKEEFAKWVTDKQN
jgi:cytochrome c oxidase subunit 2